jgi:hypothetical protein
MYFEPLEFDTVYKVNGNVCTVIHGGVKAILDGAIIYACGVGTVAVAAVAGSKAFAVGKHSKALATAEGAEAVSIGGLYWDDEKLELVGKYCKAEALAEGAKATVYGCHASAEACVKGAIAISKVMEPFGIGHATQFKEVDENENN